MGSLNMWALCSPRAFALAASSPWDIVAPPPSPTCICSSERPPLATPTLKGSRFGSPSAAPPRFHSLCPTCLNNVYLLRLFVSCVSSRLCEGQRCVLGVEFQRLARSDGP